MMMKAKSGFRLEEYMDICENPQGSRRFTVSQLNQVIWLYGFSKLQRRPKDDLADALSCIDLQPAERSTLQETVTPLAFLELEEARDDLDALDWQECPVQSIRILKSVEETLLAADLNSIWAAYGHQTIPADASPCAPLAFPAAVRRSRSKNMSKKRRIQQLSGHLGVCDDGALPSSSWPSC